MFQKRRQKHKHILGIICCERACVCARWTFRKCVDRLPDKWSAIIIFFVFYSLQWQHFIPLGPALIKISKNMELSILRMFSYISETLSFAKLTAIERVHVYHSNASIFFLSQFLLRCCFRNFWMGHPTPTRLDCRHEQPRASTISQWSRSWSINLVSFHFFFFYRETYRHHPPATPARRKSTENIKPYGCWEWFHRRQDVSLYCWATFLICLLSHIIIQPHPRYLFKNFKGRQKILKNCFVFLSHFLFFFFDPCIHLTLSQTTSRNETWLLNSRLGIFDDSPL